MIFRAFVAKTQMAGGWDPVVTCMLGTWAGMAEESP